MTRVSMRGAALKKAVFWREQIEGWRRSGLTQAEYCRRTDLAKSSFQYWRRRLRAEEAASSEGPVVVPVSIKQLTSQKRPEPIFLHAGGYRIELGGEFCPATLERLLWVLGRAE